MTPRMEISERTVGDVTVLELAGRLELDDGDTVFRDAVNRLVDQGRLHLVLDRAHGTRLDSAGIGMLVSKYLSLTRRGGSMTLFHLTDRARQLLHITRLDTVFDIAEHEEQAVKHGPAA